MTNYDHIELAQNIVRGNIRNFSSTQAFIETSGIYKFTNEDIAGYFHHFQNKKNILSVISSGNHILNAILAGARNIDCFDISIFPQYYLYLQLASVLTLSKEDYLKYYFSDDREEVFSDYFYDLIKKNMSPKYKEFWDSLYNFDDGFDIYNSLLFRQDMCLKSAAIERNMYLQDDNYDKLKHILQTEHIEINPVVADIIKTKFEKEYDLVVLSNILAYYFNQEELEKYISYLKSNFNLTTNGEIINYFYHIDNQELEKFNKLLNVNSSIENINGKKLLVLKK